MARSRLRLVRSRCRCGASKLACGILPSLGRMPHHPAAAATPKSRHRGGKRSAGLAILSTLGFASTATAAAETVRAIAQRKSSEWKRPPPRQLSTRRLRLILPTSAPCDHCAAAMPRTGQLTDPAVLQHFFLAAAVMAGGLASLAAKTVGAAGSGACGWRPLLLVPMEPWRHDSWRLPSGEGHIRPWASSVRGWRPTPPRWFPCAPPEWGLIKHQDVSAIYPR